MQAHQTLGFPHFYKMDFVAMLIPSPLSSIAIETMLLNAKIKFMFASSFSLIPPTLLTFHLMDGFILFHGDGFTLDRILANPSAFFTDSHTMMYPAGVVRGQLSRQYYN